MDFKTDTYPTPTYTNNQARRIRECLDQLVATIPMDRRRCTSCGKNLDIWYPNDPDTYAHIYDHDGGIGLIGDIPKQWVSFECTCGYHTSLNKMRS